MRKIDFNLNEDIYIISDIHGGYEQLKKLLGLVSANSKLIILGDIIEKGEYSLDTLEYIMEMDRLDNVYVLKGNNEAAVVNVFNDDHLHFFINRMDNKTSLIYQMLERQNLVGNPKELQEQLRLIYQKHINWMNDLESIIETDDFIFVHAGIDNIPDYQNSHPKSLTNLKNFYFQGHLANKMVVCGHYPVAIFRFDRMDDSILIDHDKKIICLDGGYGTKTYGQLNMLKITKTDLEYNYHTYDVDSFETVKIVKAQKGMGNLRGICYPSYQIEFIEEGLYFTKAINSDGEKVFIKNEYLIFQNDHYYASDDIPNNLLEVVVGDVVKVLSNKTKGYALVKKDGVSGWVTYDCLPKNIEEVESV
jgi:protein phosphatase